MYIHILYVTQLKATKTLTHIERPEATKDVSAANVVCSRNPLFPQYAVFVHLFGPFSLTFFLHIPMIVRSEGDFEDGEATEGAGGGRL